MQTDSMTKLEKLDWIHRYLHKTLNGEKMCSHETQIAIGFIEDIRDGYIQDYK